MKERKFNFVTDFEPELPNIECDKEQSAHCTRRPIFPEKHSELHIEEVMPF